MSISVCDGSYWIHIGFRDRLNLVEINDYRRELVQGKLGWTRKSCWFIHWRSGKEKPAPIAKAECFGSRPILYDKRVEKMDTFITIAHTGKIALPSKR
ncbi:MAG: hypothetical protein IT250_05585 [Chitinophagaceae bacterium]|nr:hypothetical protein [Chitinophagaceae bacterium]